MKSFAVGLLYPAVVGTMIVLLFLRITSLNFAVIGDLATWFGVLIALYYSFGFVHSDTVEPYTPGTFFLDCASSVLIFICYHLLGLNDISPQAMASSAQELWPLYLSLLPVTISPMLRRKIRLKSEFMSDFRDYVCLLAAIVVVLPLAGLFLSWQFLQFDGVIVLCSLWALMLVYVFDVAIRGMSS